VMIDFFSVDDLAHIRSVLSQHHAIPQEEKQPQAEVGPQAPSPSSEPKQSNDDLYSIKNFTV
ncbi:MAG: hypothetical protein HY460_00230, partial [Parcubacteria group bacterium]|nr:hypothetical protein [Parcubacteria group bacterium]